MERLEELIDVLRRRRVLDKTVIMVLGDNSNLSGQHRLSGKGYVFEESINPY